MTLKALFYAYLLGGITFLPLLLAGVIIYTVYTSVPIAETPSTADSLKTRVQPESADADTTSDTTDAPVPSVESNDLPRTRKGWLTMRRTFEESALDGGYVMLVRSFLDARSKDPKRSRPKDMWYIVLKEKVLYLYEDEQMTECEAAIELGGHDVVIYPECLLDGELFTKRHAICIRPKAQDEENEAVGMAREAKATKPDSKREKMHAERKKDQDPSSPRCPWFIFVRTNVEMEDWYFALIHASDHPAKTPCLAPLQAVFQPSDMNHLVNTLDEQPDVIPTRWLNALLGRIFFSFYQTHLLEAYIIGRLMKKLAKVKRPTFLTDIVVTEVSVGNKAPTLSKPMLKELTKEGDGAMEVHFQYKGEFRITIEATAIISIGTFKSYNVKLVLAVVLKELEGNLLVKVKRPPSNRIWYAFTQTPRMVLAVEPIVSDRQLTWSMILGTIESRLKEIIQESVVMPNMDDIAFFDSSEYHHRGGIWQDASRRERQVPPLAEHAIDANDQPLPVLDTTLVAEPTPSTQVPQMGEVSRADGALPPPSQAVPEDTSVVPANNDVPEQSTKFNRPRSWFSSVRSEDINTFSRMEDAVVDGELDDEQRGRSTQSEKSKATLPRSQSTPNKPEGEHLNHVGRQERDDRWTHENTHLASESVKRSSSRHSLKREHERSPSIDSSVSPLDSTKTPPKNATISSTSTFLSTLKSRAGDKQALSNTAKEAMRKWGVNWGGLKKDSAGEESDHGSIMSAIGSKLRSETTLSVTSKTRTSYAEVKAAVAERKGRDRDMNHPDGDSGRSRSPSPVTVLGGTKHKARAASNPWSEGRSSTEASTLASVNLSASPAAFHERRLSTSSSTSRKSNSSGSRLTVENDEHGEVGTLQSTPTIVHLQPPKATMMTIPGIHASHRGEIMSMGYNAPPKAPSTISSEGKSAIQSVYRLWKNPASSGDQLAPSLQQTSSQDSQDIAPPTEREDRNADSLNLAPRATSPQPRPTPPPLPPRSTPSPAISRSSAEPASIEPTPVSASQALQTITASKEEVPRRDSLEHDIDPRLPPPAITIESSNNIPPPLPPRRTHAQQV